VLLHLEMTRQRPAAGRAPCLAWPKRGAAQACITGLLYLHGGAGQTVAQGTLVARVTDFHGNLLEEIRSPFAGEILYVVATRRYEGGEPVGFRGGASHALSRDQK